MGLLEELDICLKHFEQHIELAPDSPLEILKGKKLDEEARESKRETAGLGPLPESLSTNNERCLWREQAGVMSSGSNPGGDLELEQISAKWTWWNCQIQEAEEDIKKPARL